MTQKKYRVTNIDNIIKEFDNKEFLEYAQAIYRENEDGQSIPSEIHWCPENLQQAEEYINEYCDDLVLEKI